jgi:glycosyltransferase involved in cell wall biosynthesis
MNSSVEPLEIIFAGSSQSETSAQELEAVRKLYPRIVKIYTTPNKCTAGQNRNRGWEIAQGEYISFCDADDLYSTGRLEILRNEIDRSGAELIIHDYLYQCPLLFLRFTHKNYQIFESAELFESTFPGGNRNRDDEFGPAGESNIMIPLEYRSNFRVHHGHATVKTSVKVRYSDFPFAEDGIFCRDMLFTGYKISYISAKLSIYETFSFRGIVRNSILRAIVEITKIKKRWI